MKADQLSHYCNFIHHKKQKNRRGRHQVKLNIYKHAVKCSSRSKTKQQLVLKLKGKRGNTATSPVTDGPRLVEAYSTSFHQQSCVLRSSVNDKQNRLLRMSCPMRPLNFPLFDQHAPRERRIKVLRWSCFFQRLLVGAQYFKNQLSRMQ